MGQHARVWWGTVSIVVLALGLGGAGTGCGGGASDGTSRVFKTGGALGRVFLSPDVPAAGCWVSAVGTGNGSPCDPRGVYQVSGIPDGRRTLRLAAAEGAGDFAERSIDVAINRGLVTNVETVILGRPGSIGGRVIDPSGAVDLRLAIVGIPGIGVVTAPTEQHAYLLVGVPPGVHDVVLLTETGAEIVRQVVVKPEQITTGVDFTVGSALPPPAHLLGQALRASDEPGEHAGIEVELLSALTGLRVGQPVTTGADGAFDLVLPRPGAYAVRARSGGASVVLPNLLHFAGDVPLAVRLVVPSGLDHDGDGIPDSADPDDDADGFPDEMDAFPLDFAEHLDVDHDGLGDAGDLQTLGGPGIDTRNPTPDGDGDTRFDFEDNCPARANTNQSDRDGDGRGDACDVCPIVYDPEQRDADGDGLGDACPDTSSCTQRNAECGPVSDGMGGVIDCGSCSMAGQVCGASGVANRCGATCATAVVCPSSRQCGTIPDGCGATLACGSGCGPGQLCDGSGLCQACAGLTSCAAQGKNCGFIPDGCNLGGELPCGPCVGPATCGGGGTANVCGVGTNTVTVASGNGQTGLPGQTLGPVRIQVVRGGLAVAGAPVTVTSQQGATALGVTATGTATTNLMGEMTFTPVLGRSPGTTYVWNVMVTGTAGTGSVEVSATSTTPSDTATNLVVPVVNASHLTTPATALTALPTPASLFRTGSGNLRAIAVARDGTIYVGDTGTDAILAVSPSGVISKLAGGNPTGPTSDGVLATAARLRDPSGLAIDEPADGSRKLLYVAEQGADKIRVIDLKQAAPTIEAFAGGGVDSGEPYGDGGPAVGAVVVEPHSLAIDVDGSVYVAQNSLNGMVRRIDRGDRVIRRVLSLGGPTPALNSCSTSVGCAVAVDADGTVFVAGKWSFVPNSNSAGIFRRSGSGWVRVAGGGTAGITSGEFAQDVGFSSTITIAAMAFDRAGQLFFTYDDVLYRIDRVGRMWRVSGGSTGAGGDFGPAAAATWNQPMALSFQGADLYVADMGNSSVRMLGALGRVSDDYTLSAVSGGMQRALLGNRLTDDLVARLVDGAGQPVEGVPISFSTSSPGAAIASPSTRTSVTGQALAAVRVALVSGVNLFDGRAIDIHGRSLTSPVTYMVSADAPSDGTLFPLVNFAGVSGSVSSGPSTLAQIGVPTQPVVGSDGTVYFADSSNDAVLALDPAGVLSRVAGTGSPGFAGDTQPAVQAQLSGPTSLAYDPGNQLLFVADTGNDRIRAIELGGARRIYTVAGGGTQTAEPYGDTFAATSARLDAPGLLTRAPDGTLFFVDNIGSARIRRFVPGGDIFRVYTTEACSGSYFGSLAATLSSRLMVGGHLCSRTGGVSGLAEFEPVTGDSTRYAPLLGFGRISGLAYDGASNLFVGELMQPRIRRIDKTTLVVTNVAGDGTAGFLGDYGPAPAARFRQELQFTFTPQGDLVIADLDNFAVRKVWRLAP